ncbi:MAG: polysaccharide deacetylase family protein [Pirellulaceae bacterium]|nr:polysaccharide deacetylase family protein [Pirellulaceae bacterium]
MPKATLGRAFEMFLQACKPHGFLRGNHPLILAYHSVSLLRTDSLAVSADNFRAQLEWLKKHNYQIVTLNEALEHSGDRRKLAVLTFDDGYADNYQVAYPIMKEFDFRGTIFLVSTSVGTKKIFWWDQARVDAGESHEANEVLSWEQVHEMQDNGFEFGSHTATHRLLPTLSVPERISEIENSKQTLEDALGRPVTSFCYPEGRLDELTTELVEKAGYSQAVVTVRGESEPYGTMALRRVGVYYHVNLQTFGIKNHRFVRRFREPLQLMRNSFA